MTVNIALNYGGRAEILRGIRKLFEDKKETVTEEEFSQLLYTAGQPDPDFIIRTGGERRLSGYLPWQAVYAELYFTPVFWPDFNPEEFGKALEDFENRHRRFGK
jgi:undecaprenyl diphosphate synthase